MNKNNFQVQNNHYSKGRYQRILEHKTIKGFHVNNNNNKNFKGGIKRKLELYTCDTCGIEANSLEMWNSHLKGQRHAKKIRQAAESQIKLTENNLNQLENKIKIKIEENSDNNLKNNSNNPIVSNTIVKINNDNNESLNLNVSNKSVLQFIHELAVYHKLKADYTLEKESGPSHAKVFEMKLSIGNEVYHASGTSLIKAKHAVAEIALKNTKLEKPNAEQLKKRKTVATKNSNKIDKEKSSKNKVKNNNVIEPINTKASMNKVTATNNIKKNDNIKKQDKNDNNNNNSNSNKIFDDFTTFDIKQQFQQQQYQNLSSNLFSNSNNLNMFPPLVTSSTAYLLSSDKTETQIKNENYDYYLEAFNRRHLLFKHEQLYPTNDQLELIQIIITDIEKALKLISDKLCDELKPIISNNIDNSHQNNNDENDDDDDNNNNKNRILKGVMRVGFISKGLLLKSDRNLHLVVLCLNKPTITLLERVSKELNNILINYKIDVNIANSCLYIQKNVYNVQLSFTSTEYENNENINDNNHVFYLPKQKCVDYLTEIKRARWFQTNLLPITNSLLIMRLLRDLCQRNPTWSILNNWTLEIIVEKCFLNKPYERIGFKFRTIMEAIASGILLPRYANMYLLDPCEKDYKTVIDYLTMQQCEFITESAQYLLRLISFKQIYKILGIELIPLQKVKLNNNDNNDIDTNDNYKNNIKTNTNENNNNNNDNQFYNFKIKLEK